MPTAEERLKRHLENIMKANRKYRETHREAVNEQKRNYYHNKLSHNPEFIEKKRALAKAYYWKKKNQEQLSVKTTSENK